jgi:membrane-bound metal-dependent hydrolase YbcI (DUF457 family)
MPLTPFHLGPALAVGLPLRKYFHLPTFILANVVLDVEPLLVIVFGLNYPLHGYLHTLLLALVVGLVVGFALFKLEGAFSGFYQKIKLETANPLRLRGFFLAGVCGTFLHVLFDALLYTEMKPFFPWSINPLLNMHVSTSQVYLLCTYLGALGGVYYVGLLIYSLYSNSKHR